ncbi:MAG: lamin tail domain-containing protein, partial [Bacteroidales bacterium]|nr:lamin tail domain-containing protein [Bacteroidales bacterium]
LTDGGDNWGTLDPPTPGSTNTPAPQVNIVINEFLAGNETINTDEDGDYEDWIEIYNAGTQSVDLSGYTITDDDQEPTQWIFPAVTLDADSYLLLWASKKDRSTGELHTNFSLKKSGEYIGLYKPDGILLDSYTFGEQSDDISAARIPNGDGNFKLTASPTPGASNTFTSPPEDIPEIVINEFLAGNDNINTDEDGDDEDWIELYNAGTEAVDLGGYTLIEDAAEPGQWTFPSVTVEPNHFLLVWASKKDRAGAGELHTNFSLGKSGEFIGLYSPSGTAVDSITFGAQTDDISYARFPDGTGGFSYTITPTPEASNIITAPPEDIPEIVINEFLASNDNTNTDEDGDDSDWIELYNTGTETIDLIGFTITDNPDDKNKCTFPSLNLAPNDYLLVWASNKDRTGNELHTNFKLSAGGEFVGLYTASGTVVDTVTFGEQTTNISMARLPNGIGGFQQTINVTPGTQNQSGVPPVEPLTFFPESGYYNGSVSVTLSTGVPGGKIRYTTNGSSVKQTSTSYTGPINVTSTKLIRACVFVNSVPVSEDISHLYVIDFNGHLPVLSLSTDENNLYGSSGIFDNYSKKGDVWERPVSVNLLEKDGSGFKINAGIRVHGQYSRSYPKKSVRLYFRSEYGESKLHYKVFDQKNINKFDKLIIHSGGAVDQYYPPSPNGEWYWDQFTLLRDPFNHALWHEKGGNISASRPILLYINNEFWGIYHIRERIDIDYLEENRNITDADILKVSHHETPSVEEGDLTKWNELWNYVKNNNIRSTSKYNHVKELMDIDNFIDYNIIEIFGGHKDWPHNNIYMFREKQSTAKWEWILWDSESTHNKGVNWNGLEWATRDRVRTDLAPSDSENLLWATLLLRNLVKNEEFNQLFINRFADFLNSVFRPDHLLEIFNNMATTI